MYFCDKLKVVRMGSFFKDIEVMNFRGFDYLKMENFSKINVVVGANNVGKSSVLEAIFMLVGMSVPMLPARVNYWRKNTNSSLDEVRYLFHNIDFGNIPVLKARTTDGERKVQLSPSLYVDSESASGNLGHAGIKRLNIDFGTNLNEECQYHTVLYIGSDGSMQQLADDKYKEQMNCLFISSDKNDSNALANFVTLVKRGKKDVVLKALQSFDSDITGVEALPDGLYLSIKGMKELLPISMAGDGVRRILNIVSSIATEDYNVVMIDEIDTGLHYSAHKLMWKAVLEFVSKYDIQLFVTTHNIECLQSLAAVMDKEDVFKPLASVYNISKTLKKGFQTYRYVFGELKEAVNNEIEIRQ